MRIQLKFVKFLLSTLLVAGTSLSLICFAADRDHSVGAGAQTCFNVSKKFQAFDLERDEATGLNRAVIEKSRIDNKEEKLKELNAPVLEKHKLQTDSYREQLREFALGMLQSELLKENPEEFLMELENFDYVNKFLAQCRDGGQAHDLLFQIFVRQVLDGNHKAMWLRISR